MNLFKDVELFFKNCKNCFLFKLRKTKTERGATSIRSSNESKDDQDKEPTRRQRRSLTPASFKVKRGHQFRHWSKFCS